MENGKNKPRKIKLENGPNQLRKMPNQLRK
jgi:hypothetical protein